MHRYSLGGIMTLDGMTKELFSFVHFSKGSIITSILCRSRDLE